MKWSKIVLRQGKKEILNYAWICIYAPVNVRNGRGREMKFWNNVNECLRTFEEAIRSC